MKTAAVWAVRHVFAEGMNCVGVGRSASFLLLPTSHSADSNLHVLRQPDECFPTIVV
jgi:hypothetical protein